MTQDKRQAERVKDCNCGAGVLHGFPHYRLGDCPTKRQDGRADQIYVRYCSHPDGHAPKDCPNRKPQAPRIVAECWTCLTDSRPLLLNDLSRSEAVKQSGPITGNRRWHKRLGHDVRPVGGK